MTARALTVIVEAPTAPGARLALAHALVAIRDDVAGNPVLRPADLPDTHFTRWAIISDTDPEEPHPDLLVWESNHDGDTFEYLAAVVAAVPGGLDALYGGCADYPRAGAAAAPDEVIAWLGRHAVRAAAAYSAYRWLPHAQVKNDLRVRAALGELLDLEGGAVRHLAPREIQARLRARLAAEHPELSVVDDGDGAAGVLVRRIAVGAALLVVGLALLPVVAILLVLVRRAELADRDQIEIDAPVHDPGGHHLIEDRVMQNQLTHVVDVKPGLVRIVTVWVVLAVIDALAGAFYVNGTLQGMTTIHFARWVILFDRRPRPARRRHRVLFFSNYDGSWDAYLGEFIDRGSPGLTAIWSNTARYPRTRWLFGQGSRDEESFKQLARENQRPRLPGEIQAWWSGIPSATVANVRDAAWVRRRVTRRLDDEEIDEWLRRL